MHRRYTGLPLAGCKFAGTTKDGYDGSEMLFFIDESLEILIREYEGQLAKYEILLGKAMKGGECRTSAESESNALMRDRPIMAA